MLSEGIICAAIAGGAAIASNFITAKGSENKIQTKLAINQAVMDEKISELTREVREHNEFARRMPALEMRIEKIEKYLNIE